MQRKDEVARTRGNKRQPEQTPYEKIAGKRLRQGQDRNIAYFSMEYGLATSFYNTFKSGKITPQKIFWNNKEYEIKTVSYYWQERCGQELLHYFSVNTGSNLYQISFNNISLRWQIDKIIE